MDMIDRLITVSIGSSRRSTNWQPSQTTIAGFRKRLASPVRGPETLAEFMRLKKAAQDDLKDVGGFVGGRLNGPRRKAGSVAGRDVITFDADNIPAGHTDDVRLRIGGLGVKADMYSTAKHHGAAPRLRLLIYADREATADEYEPCARKLAEIIDPSMAMFDPTTFEASRLMYFPRCSADSEFVHESYEGPFVSVDGLLAQYADWRDVSLWPALPGAQALKKLAVKQGDPEAKPGVVGAFCRAYDVQRAMDELLPGVYAPADGAPGRHTYLGGSTAGGAVVYDGGKFLFSHHATDPCSGRLVNAFDLVRLHRFADLDDDAKDGRIGKNLPSYKAMVDVALSDSRVARQMASDDFAGAPAGGGGSADGAAPNWAEGLARDANGAYRKSIKNIRLMIENLPGLNGVIRRDAFSGKIVIGDSPPWDRWAERKLWGDADTTSLREFLEHWFKPSKQDIRDTLGMVADRRAFHPVRDYLTPLTWDGVPRLDSLFIDYLSAVDTPYTRAVTRKCLTAAVKRVMEPGCKYDYMVVFVGKQGRGKSMMIKTLSPVDDWASDSQNTFQGRDAMETLQGKWIIEVPEMHAFDKAEMGAVKAFITKQRDYYRAAYAEFPEERMRQCVLFGTTNNHDCLRDNTGNRRFWPIDCGDWQGAKKEWNVDLPMERDQIWAEAVMRWRMGETVFLTREMEEEANAVQEAHREKHPWEDTVIEFLNRRVPLDWDAWPVDRRMSYWSGNVVGDIETAPRRRICCREIWQEAFCKDLASLTIQNARAINGVLAAQDGWALSEKIRCGLPYGVQKGFETRM